MANPLGHDVLRLGWLAEVPQMLGLATISTFIRVTCCM